MNLYIKASKYFILNTFFTQNSRKRKWLTELSKLMTETQTDSVYRLRKLPFPILLQIMSIVGSKDWSASSSVWFLSFSCGFRQKICQIIEIIDWCTPTLRLAPPCLGNPGSATDVRFNYHWLASISLMLLDDQPTNENNNQIKSR